MEEIEKRIQISENRILIYRILEGYAKPTYTIMEGFIENSDVIKTYSLSQWDDYGLNGWARDDDNIDRLSFEFDMDHPLFFPLFHLLNYDDELLIDDDDTREDNKKYMLIHRKEDKIYIDFVDVLKDSIHSTHKFHVFIKNIGPDGRSKIDQDYKDTKKRLFVFFKEANNALIDDYHQISFEEYLLEKSTHEGRKQLKKVFKREISNHNEM